MGFPQNPFDTIVPWSFIRLRVTCTSTCNRFFATTHCPGFVKSSFLSSFFLPCFKDFVCQFVQCCAPNMQDTHGGGQYLRRRKFFDRSPAFDSQNIIEHGRWKSRWCMSINYFSAGFNDLGWRIDVRSWSLSCLAASWTLGKVVGSDGTSGFSGRLRLEANKWTNRSSPAVDTSMQSKD